MQANEIKLSAKERLGRELKSISEDVSINDKIAFMQEFGKKKSTVSDYLRGHVLNIDVAMEMLLFFRKKIQEREKNFFI